MKYPIYIPSKGRASNLKTVKLLEKHGVFGYYVVVEKHEAKEYAQYVRSTNLLVLPGSHYGTSSVARNFCIKHSEKLGFKKHWQLDDDISRIYMHDHGAAIHDNVKNIFKYVEHFCEKRDWIKMAGINTSSSFLVDVKKELQYNTSLTSCFLITNTKFRFRLRMLVDMDYQLQLLAAGHSTLRFLNFAFTFVTPGKQAGGYAKMYADIDTRMTCIQEFLDLHPEIKPGLKRLANGIWVAANIRFVWKLYRKNNLQKQ